MVSRDRPPWADKVRFWLSDDLYEQVEKHISRAHDTTVSALRAVEGRIENAAENLETFGLWALCTRYGHEPVADQCNLPEHDFCVYCHKRMPGTAHGPQY